MYCAKKRFNGFKEAINGFYLSNSLRQSDLGCFTDGANSLEDVKKRVDEEIERYKEKGRDGYGYNIPEMRDDGFEYTTYSGINTADLTVVKDGEKIIGYDDVYYVYSAKPMEYSTAMKAFTKEGWECCNLDMTYEEENQEKKEYEKNLIDKMRECQEVPDVKFYLSCYKGKVTYISSYQMEKNQETVLTLMESHPEIMDDVLKIIPKQIKKIKSINVPTTYDYNELIYTNSDFYIKRKEEVIQLLEEIKEKIIKEKEIRILKGKSKLYDDLSETGKKYYEVEKFIKSNKIKE